jgi:hypothetical protein
MPIVSVNLSDLAHNEFKRIPRGQRSRVVSQGLELRSLDAVTHVEGRTGHELAEMVVELRDMLRERSVEAVRLARDLRDLELQNTLKAHNKQPKVKGRTEKASSGKLGVGDEAKADEIAEKAKAEVAARLKRMGEDE